MVVAGLALLVSGMGSSEPPLSKLMPVLASPLLSIHVMVIMLAYALAAFMALSGVAALLVRGRGEMVERLALISRVMLTPTVILLAVGIFLGAVWANQSWGRYWGWDPKETWALITLLVYTLPLHVRSFSALARPRVLHTYLLVAFSAILFTYFGVNFLLTGLHSYAG